MALYELQLLPSLVPSAQLLNSASGWCLTIFNLLLFALFTQIHLLQYKKFCSSFFFTSVYVIHSMMNILVCVCVFFLGFFFFN